MPTIALIQTRVSPDKKDAIRHMETRIREAAASGAQVMLLPELFASPYFCQEEDHAFFALSEASDGPTVSGMAVLAKELGVVIVVPFFERVAAGVYFNTAAVIDADGTVLGQYRKMHIPDDPGFYEKFYFAPGDLGYQVFPTRYGNIGVLICWDQWYPEAARLTALRGADILVYPTAIGWHPQEKVVHGEMQFQAWQRVQLGHAVANGVFVAAINRVGFEKRCPEANDVDPVVEKCQPFEGIDFWGRSFLAGPQGEILAQAAESVETLLYDVDFSRIETIRQHWPFFRDRRIDSYADITKRYIGLQG
jgi:N-carbamoylputrescine amidase